MDYKQRAEVLMFFNDLRQALELKTECKDYHNIIEKCIDALKNYDFFKNNCKEEALCLLDALRKYSYIERTKNTETSRTFSILREKFFELFMTSKFTFMIIER